MKTKQIAIEACRELAGWIRGGGCDFAWLTADRIERRWGIQGTTEHFLKQWQRERDDYNREQSRLADIRFPDRLTYLHR